MGQLIVPALTQAFASMGLGAQAAGIAANLTSGLLLSTAARAVARGQQTGLSQSDVSADIAYPRTLPPVRFAYGRTRLRGSWAPGWVVNGDYLYGCIILNSRPSAGGVVDVFFDKRPVSFTGDPFDFTGAGGVADFGILSGHASFWVGLGDQVAPPDQIMTEWGDPAGTDAEKFWPSDGWRGSTVLWVRLNRGDPNQRGERWPNGRPDVEVEADWSKVWDMRDPAQDAGDPSTWTYSDNQALCVLDAARQNPLRRWALNQIALDDFEEGADVADEAVPVQAGGTEPRYRVGYLLVFKGDTELMTALDPLVRAGAGNLSIAGGRLRYVPGKYYAPVATFGDVLNEEPVRYVRSKAVGSTARAIRARFPNPGDQWEDFDLDPVAVPGQSWTPGEDGAEEFALPAVPFSRQAMRLAKIEALLRGTQEELSAVFPPEAVRLLPGARLTTAFPGPDVRNGTWRVTERRGGHWIEAGDGVAFRVPMDLARDDPSIWAWDASEEQAIDEVTFSAIDLGIDPPGAITATTTYANTGDAYVASHQFSAPQSPSRTVRHYRWEYRENDAAWLGGGIVYVDRDTSDPVRFSINQAAFNVSYDVRLFAVGDYSESTPVQADNAIVNFDLSGVSFAVQPGGVGISGTLPESSFIRGLRVYRNTADNFSTADLVSDITLTVPGGEGGGLAGTPFSIVAGKSDAVNIVDNGDFADATGWTLPGGWSISGGVASHVANGANNTMYRAASMTAGADYRWTVTMDSSSAGSALVRLMGASNVNSAAFAASTVHQGVLTAPASPANVGILAGTTLTADFDDFVIVRDDPALLPQGPAFFWIVPVTSTLTEGPPVASGELVIY